MIFGEYFLFGKSNQSSDINEVRKRVGAIIESPALYPDYDAFSNLFIMQDLVGIYDKEQIQEILTLV